MKKHEIVELLPHFDDDGKLLAGRKVLAKGCSVKDWTDSAHDDLADMIVSMKKFNAEYRIESVHVAPRVVWINGGVSGLAENTHPAKELAQQWAGRGTEPVRFIEDVPLPVSDEITNECLQVNNHDLNHGGSYFSAMKSALQHYESQRTAGIK